MRSSDGPRGRTPLTTMRLEIPIRDAIDAHARSNGLTRSGFIRDAVLSALAREGIEVAAT